MLCVQFQIPSWNSFTLSISKAVNSNVCRGFNPPSSIINKSVQQPTGWKSDLFPPNTTGHHFLSAIPCIFDGTEPAIKGTLAGGAGTGNGSWFLMASLSDYLIALQKSIQDLFLREPNNSGSLSYPGLKPSPYEKGISISGTTVPITETHPNSSSICRGGTCLPLNARHVCQSLSRVYV